VGLEKLAFVVDPQDGFRGLCHAWGNLPGSGCPA
jgi:hypothetical protein